MSITAVDYSVVCEIVRARSGIVLGPGNEYLVEARLTPVARAAGLRSLADLVQKLRETRQGPLLERVVEAMTTNETSFFRDIHPFDALREHVLPDLIRTRAAERKLSIWCAAASSGQEPYSIAMVVRDNFPELRSWKLDFIATDLSREMIERCRSGIFSPLEVERGLSHKLRSSFFERKDDDWRVVAELRELINFRQMNLTEVWPKLPSFDLIFIRNVLIYFDEATKQKILAQARARLAPTGWLFLGSSETSLNLDVGLQDVRVGRTTAFRPRQQSAAAKTLTAQPKTATGQSHPRFQLPCFLAFRTGKDVGRAIVVDISQSGARLDRPVPVLPVGARLVLEIHLVDGDDPVSVEASVVRTTATGVAIHFVSGSPGQKHIADFLIKHGASAAGSAKK